MERLGVTLRNVVTEENILVFIMFELTLLTSQDFDLSSPRWLFVWYRFIGSTLIFLFLDHLRNKKSVQGSVVCRFSTLVLGSSPHSPTLHLLYKKRERA